jgi:uncharacterized ion transporter superfamily protein YfcC
MVENFNLVSEFKDKITKSISMYILKKIESSKEEVIKQVEKHIEKFIERKIKKELNKLKRKIVFYMSFLIGLIFLFYGIFEVVFYIFNIPQEFVNITIGSIILLISIVYYLFS